DINPDWVPVDPTSVSVSSGAGRVVRITVRRAGASNLSVRLPGVSRDLLIYAVPEQGNALKVEILQ
ncbi:MAG: hypothetical protein KGJ52_04780, partial [Gammaproteobacteria bacterium]|nr:hypothetical protein [Gammaproteobacteria bacterium]